MADPPTIEELIANATFAVKAKYSVNNSNELKSTVADIFSFSNKNVQITDVRGTPESFRASIKLNITAVDAEEFIKQYQIHNNETLKVAHSRYVSYFALDFRRI